jgi:hypothetical protein
VPRCLLKWRRFLTARLFRSWLILLALYRDLKPECLVQCRLADPEPGGGFPHGQTLRNHTVGARQLVGVDDGLATAFSTACSRCGKAGAGAFSDQVALETPAGRQARRAPLAFSARITSQPAAFSAARWIAKS